MFWTHRVHGQHPPGKTRYCGVSQQHPSRHPDQANTQIRDLYPVPRLETLGSLQVILVGSPTVCQDVWFYISNTQRARMRHSGTMSQLLTPAYSVC